MGRYPLIFDQDGGPLLLRSRRLPLPPLCRRLDNQSTALFLSRPRRIRFASVQRVGIGVAQPDVLVQRRGDTGVIPVDQFVAGLQRVGLHVPTALQAVLAAVSLLVGSGPARSVFVPVWAACPAIGYGDRDALPGLRSDAADRLVGRGQRVTWPVVFLHLVAEAARAGRRELDRLLAAAEKGRGVVAGCDRRSRLPDVVETLLRVPVLTPKALAARLRIAPQTATASLRELQHAGLVKEVTGRGSFRAIAI
jgi:hypothetical protein